MITELNNLVEKGFVTKRKHPEYDLWIYNYSPKTQIDGYWNKYTMAARGLIVDANNEIISRPFPKFFNLDELPKYKNYLHHWYKCSLKDLLKMPFNAYSKEDGSLGISYFYDGKWAIATRGSFESEQAKHATDVLNSKYKDVLDKLNPSYTYLWEIIYPENRIVLDYEGLDDLILLTIIKTDTQKEVNSDVELPFPKVKTYSISNIDDLVKLETYTNIEGAVIRFENGVRAKFKISEYKRLHKIMTGITPARILECLKSGQSLNEWLGVVPDEFYQEVKAQALTFQAEFDRIEEEAKSEFNRIQNLKLPNRKAFAEYAKDYKYPSLLFNLLDNRCNKEKIWSIIEEC